MTYTRKTLLEAGIEPTLVKTLAIEQQKYEQQNRQYHKARTTITRLIITFVLTSLIALTAISYTNFYIKQGSVLVLFAIMAALWLLFYTAINIFPKQEQPNNQNLLKIQEAIHNDYKNKKKEVITTKLE